MIELKTKVTGGNNGAAASEQLRLPFDLRQKSRLRTKLVSGEDAWLLLPRGEILRGGDLLLGTDGRVVSVYGEGEGSVRSVASGIELISGGLATWQKHGMVKV